MGKDAAATALALYSGSAAASTAHHQLDNAFTGVGVRSMDEWAFGDDDGHAIRPLCFFRIEHKVG